MITIYGAAFCGWCTKAKELADKLEIEHEYIDIQFDDRWKLVADEYEFTTIPQIFDGDTLIGGYQQFERYVMPHDEIGDL